MKRLFVNASSEPDGQTARLAAELFGAQDYQTLNLVDYHIAQIGQKTDGRDDFKRVCDQIADADMLVMGTPIYWSDMTGYMKTFIDRMTDVRLTTNPFNGKKLYLIITGTAPQDAIPSVTHVWEHVAQRYGMAFSGVVTDSKQAKSIQID
ncbi:MAG: NAD(P)H-dependent oxidoreductase [Lentilactobacillus diolivorans]|jgi:multimeric flavodoxin WrbA|uniref:flavodoxin family protein n=1 Tax=Lentilactobacillus diolivorans TaxID=179838 RepID=UPI000FF85CE1|nr:MAG: NADPH-dependent oxidoreductase [Lactobacillus sp.]